jgi:succinate dehydrogenase/fumarate reductase flavoprotein subunit
MSADEKSATSADPLAGADLTCDVLVVGSGAGGLSAALSASEAGLDVIVIEKGTHFGGTTCHSEGMIWVPMSAQAIKAGKGDTASAALAYLAAVAGNHLDRDKSAAYLDAAPAMLTFLESHTRVRYALASSLDYHPDAPGATVGARSLRVEPMDGKTLGRVFDMIRPPLASTLALGGMTVTSLDLPHALKAHRSPAAFWHMAKLSVGYAIDRLQGYARGTRIGNGHALIGCLVEALLTRGIRLMPSTACTDLIVRDRRVEGAVVRTTGGGRRVLANCGVVLAAGGFSGNAGLKRKTYAHVRRGHDHALLAAETSAGDGVHAGLGARGVFVDDLSQPAAWTPASLVPQSDGSKVAFPHYVDRNKPGFIAVDRQGRRFTNEAATYHHFVPAMIAACRDEPVTEAWLIADACAVDRYGIGATPPFPGFLGAAVRSGYLKSAMTINALSQALQLPHLAATVERFNAFAQSGVDEDFHRGETAYERACGDPTVTPNPSLAPLAKPPFYAVRLVPSDIGTFAGLRTDPRARVIDDCGIAIPGLYAAGNDAASAFGGAYPAAGVTVGLALTFGFVAGRDLAESR